MEQALFSVVACSEAFTHRQGAVHVGFAFRPIEPFCFCVDVEGPDQPCIGRGACGPQITGFHGGVHAFPRPLKQGGQAGPVHEKEHQLEAHGFSACAVGFKPRSSACSKGEVEA